MSDLISEFPSKFNGGKLFVCFFDICQEGLQFCNRGILARRCEYCNAHFHECFTYNQQVNCTQYCMDQWIQNKRCEVDSEDHKIDMYQVLFFVTVGIIAFIIIVLCFPRLRSAISSSLIGICNRRQPTLTCTTNNLPLALPSNAVISTSSNIVNGATSNVENITPGNVVNSTPGNVVNSTPSNVINGTPGNAVDSTRLEAEGRSLIERSDSEEIEHVSSNTIQRPGRRENTTRKQFNASGDRSMTYQKDVEYSTPFLSSSKNDRYLKDVKSDSATNGIPHNELPSIRSSGYQALAPCSSNRNDTGYRSAFNVT